jgi:hypothetical protein
VKAFAKIVLSGDYTNGIHIMYAKPTQGFELETVLITTAPTKIGGTMAKQSNTTKKKTVTISQASLQPRRQRGACETCGNTVRIDATLQ